MAFDKKKLIPVASVSLFFLVFLLVGYLVYRDYGLSTDEPTSYLRGMFDYQRMMGGSLAQVQSECAKMENPNICYYPPFFDMVLYRLAPYGDNGPILLHKGNLLGPGINTQKIYFQRHKFTFAFFAFSVFIFFLVGKKIFKDWKIGLLGALFLIISPRIFGYSFYNAKDIPFLSAYVISIYTLLLFLEKKNIFLAILHGIATAVLCSIRTPGIIIIPITLFFYLFDLVLAKAAARAYLKAAGNFFAFMFFSTGLFFWFNPVLYTNPIGNFIKTFNIMKQYPWSGYHTYLGQNISNQIPWHYSIVWFSISSPFFYLILFVIGIVVLVVTTLRSRLRTHFQAMRDIYLAAACAILPIVVVILEKSVLYTDNRQMYFCYPALLLISLYGFVKGLEFLKKKIIHWQVWVSAILVLGLAYPVYFMIKYHPYEEFYFNFLAGPSMSADKRDFTLDQWMVTSTDALKYILKTDHTKYITVNFIDGTPRGVFLLPEADQARLIINQEDVPMYVVDGYRYYPTEKIPAGKVYYSIKIGDTDILTIYKMDNY